MHGATCADIFSLELALATAGLTEAAVFCTEEPGAENILANKSMRLVACLSMRTSGFTRTGPSSS